MKLTASQSDRLTRAVEAAESKTSAEVVLTVLPRAEGYLSSAALLGAVAAFITLVVILFHEDVVVDPGLVIPVVGAIGVAVFALVTALPSTWRSRRVTRARAVDTAAHAAFSRHGVYKTRERTGVLVLLSLGEGEARILPDEAVLRAVPADVRAEWQARLAVVAARFDVEALAKEVEALGQRAGAFLPRVATDTDELPNAPRQEGAS